MKALFLVFITGTFGILVACTEASGSEDDTTTIRLSFNLNENSSHGQASQLFKERVEEMSDGKILVELYPNQQLGDMREQIEQVQSGVTEITLQGTSTLSGFAKPLELLELPYLFPDDEVMWEVLSGEVGEEIFRELENVNMVGLSYFTQGFRQITTSDRPIHEPEDIKGIRFRTMPSELLIDTWVNWGANVVSMDLGELYNGLQQGVVNSQDNSIETIEQTSLSEVQNYLTISNHNFLPFAFVANKDWYEELTKDHQEIVKDAALEAGEFGIGLIRDIEEEFIVKLSDEMIVNELTEEEIEVFRASSEPIYEKYSADKKNKEIIERLVEAVDEITSNE